MKICLQVSLVPRPHLLMNKGVWGHVQVRTLAKTDIMNEYTDHYLLAGDGDLNGGSMEGGGAMFP